MFSDIIYYLVTAILYVESYFQITTKYSFEFCIILLFREILETYHDMLKII